MVYSLINLFKLIIRGSLKSILIITGNIILIFFSLKLVTKTRGMSRFSDSGRRDLNVKAFEIFSKNPFLGIGFGGNDIIGVFPHNLIFQSLAQGGLVYTLPLILFLGTMIWLAYKKDIEMVPILLCILIGSLFIPNVLNSRFLPALSLILSLNL